MRKVTIDCDLCAKRIPLERGKEVMFETGSNAYHLMDLCPDCLDPILQRAESINDSGGYRQRAAALIRLPSNQVPDVART
jgi:hypothetical protein